MTTPTIITDGGNTLTVETVEKFSSRWVHIEASDDIGTVTLDLFSTAQVAALRDALDRFLVGVRDTGSRAVFGARFKP